MPENILLNIPIPPEKPTRSNWRKNSEILSILEADPIIGKIIEAESSGDPLVKSNKGAIGLMQIMPKTAEEGAGYGIDYTFDRDELLDSVKNVKFGSKYFQGLRKHLGGDNYDALIAYNWGPGNYLKWKAGGKYKVSDGKGGEKIIEYTGGSFDELPEETRDYVNKILDWDQYIMPEQKHTGGMISRNPYPYNPRPI